VSVKKATEADWYENVRVLAKGCGWAIYHVHDSRRSAAGWPDVVLMRPPTVLFRELKVAPRGRLTPSQRSWIDGLVACGADAKTWVFPGDWDEVVETLTRRKEG
jgi:hypothetical protein